MKPLLYSVSIIIGALALFACADTSLPYIVVQAEHYKKNLPRYQKPGAALSLTHSHVTLPSAGVEYAITIGINSGYPHGNMTTSISASEGLYITHGERNSSVTLDQAQITLPYHVSATTEGRYYLYINAQVEHQGIRSSRALTFIVQVGNTRTEQKQTESSSDPSRRGSAAVY